MNEVQKDKASQAIKRLSQLPPAMQDVLMAGFDLGRASVQDEKNDKKE